MGQDFAYLSELDPTLILHPSSSIKALEENGPQMIVSADGCYVTDANGHTMLDASAGLWCVNAGYGRTELADAMKDAASTLGYYHSFASSSNPWQVELAEILMSIVPEGLGKVFYGTSGSDCNDTLIKIAWHYHALRGKPGKVKLLSREQAYHGTSISTSSLTGLSGFYQDFPIPLDFVKHVDCPHYYTRGLPDESEEAFCDRLINNVTTVIEREGADTIAAFFAEPIMGAGGVIVPPKDYFPRLQALLKEHDILFAADEVICGYGRTGEWFASPSLGIKPDMMASAKGITSGYFPLSAAFITNEIWDVLRTGSEKHGNFYHGYTYSGHPIGAAVAVANLNIFKREGLVAQAKARGEYLHQQLQSLMNLPNVGEIRGMGLVAGVQLVTDKQDRVLPDAAEKIPAKVADIARQKGVIVRPLPTIGSIAMSPPLTISESEIDELVNTLTESISQVIET